MDDEILELYEKVKNKITIEEFQKKMDEISEGNEDLGFFFFIRTFFSNIW